MASIRELIELQKYQQGYKTDGPQAKYASSVPAGMLNPDRKQAIALQLVKMQEQIRQQQLQNMLREKQIEVWNRVGTPSVSDKSTAGDVANIVDNEEVGGKDANVVNDGEDLRYLQDYQNGRSSSSKVANMVSDVYPRINSSGNIVLAKKPKPKKSDAVDSIKGTGDIKSAINAALTMGNGNEPGDQSSAPQVPAYKEGQTAVNPKTGKRLIFKGGKWQNVN